MPHGVGHREVQRVALQREVERVAGDFARGFQPRGERELPGLARERVREQTVLDFGGERQRYGPLAPLEEVGEPAVGDDDVGERVSREGDVGQRRLVGGLGQGQLEHPMASPRLVTGANTRAPSAPSSTTTLWLASATPCEVPVSGTRSAVSRPCVRASTSLAPWPSRISGRPLRSATNSDTPDAPNVAARRSPRTSAAATGGAFSTAKSSSARSSCALRRSAIEPAYGAAAPGKESRTVAWRAAAARWPPPVRLDDLGVGELSLGGLEHAGARLVGTLVGAHGLDAILVGLAERGLHVAGGELVVARPRLVAPQRADAPQHGRAVLVAALVGIHLGEIDLRQLGELADDLVRRELVIARDRQVRLGGDGALGLALGLRDARDLAGLARRALRRRARLARRASGGLAGRTHAVSGARLCHVIGRVVLDVGADH